MASAPTPAATVATAIVAVKERTGRVPSNVAFSLQVSIIMLFLAASSVPTPLYSLYESEWRFSAITVTGIFGIYALAVLGALLTVGKLSDYLGRRPVLLAAIALQAVAMVIFTTAEGVPALMIARVIQGLSTGLGAGAIGAGLIDIDRQKGTVANGVGPIAGTATGSIASGLLVQYLPWPTHLAYVVVLGILAVQAAGVLLMSETVTPRSGALASLRPQISLPASARQALIAATPILFAVWSLAGFYGSLAPSLVRMLVGHTSYVLGGLGLFVTAGVASLTVFLVRKVEAERVMFLGIFALLLGVGITLGGIETTSTATFFIGSAIAGIGFGSGFQGAVRIVLPLAAPEERAGVLSTVYVVCYVAMGLPAVIAGYVAVHTDLLSTAREYAIAVLLLGVLALLGQFAQLRSRRMAIA